MNGNPPFSETMSSTTSTMKSPKIIRSQAQLSFQKDIKIKTAHLRQALHKADDESALIFRSLPTITDSASHSSKNNKSIATEADEIVRHLSTTLSRWRRTSTLAAETFAELLANTSKDKELNVETEHAIKQSDEDIQHLWTTTTGIQAEIDFVEKLLAREMAPILKSTTDSIRSPTNGTNSVNVYDSSLATTIR